MAAPAQGGESGTREVSGKASPVFAECSSPDPAISRSLRLATRTDASAINEMLNAYVADTTATFFTEPQSLTDRLAWFDQGSDVYPAMVIEHDGRVVAWGAVCQHNPRPGYRHTAEVSVHPDFQRRGFGRFILTDLIERARAAGHHTLLAVCCSESVASIALHESLGFRRAGHLRAAGRKFDRWLDVVYLQLLLT